MRFIAVVLLLALFASSASARPRWLDELLDEDSLYSISGAYQTLPIMSQLTSDISALPISAKPVLSWSSMTPALEISALSGLNDPLGFSVPTTGRSLSQAVLSPTLSSETEAVSAPFGGGFGRGFGGGFGRGFGAGFGRGFGGLGGFGRGLGYGLGLGLGGMLGGYGGYGMYGPYGMYGAYGGYPYSPYGMYGMYGGLGYPYV